MASFNLLYIELRAKDFLTILPSNEEKLSYVGTASALQEPGLIASFNKPEQRVSFIPIWATHYLGKREQKRGQESPGDSSSFSNTTWRNKLKYNCNLCSQQRSLILQKVYEAAEQAKFIRSLHIRHTDSFFLQHHFAVVQSINLLPWCTTPRETST